MVNEVIDGKTSNPYGYNGEYTDSNTGLQYLRARYYNSSIGRFITQDTYAGNIYDPITQNRYTYAGNDPINNIDPSGHFIKTLTSKIKSAVTGTVKSVLDTTTHVVKSVTSTLVSNNSIKNKAQAIVKELVSVPTQLKNNYAVNSANSIDQEIEKYVNMYNSSNSAKEKIEIKTTIENLEQQRQKLCDASGKAQAKLSDVGISDIAVIPNKTEYVLPEINIPDYSVGINEVLERNVKLAESRKLDPLHLNNAFWFYNQVKDEGPWDYKRKNSWNDEFSKYDMPYLEPTGEFLWNGKICTAEELGNINYGYTGMAMGWSEEILYTGGGIVAQKGNLEKLGFSIDFNKTMVRTLVIRDILFGEYHGDSEKDHWTIKKGIDMYKNR